MICDGYCRHIALKDGEDTFNVFYRPATRGERDHFRWVAKRLSEDTARESLFTWVDEHVEQADIPAISSWRRFDKDYPHLFETLFKAIQGLIPDSSGETWESVDSQYQRNLREGILLLRTNPKIASRSCVDCKKYWYSEKTGVPILSNSTGEKLLRQGLTLCQTEQGCPKGTPENQKTLSRPNRWAILHYLECKAVGSFPDDGLVKRNAVIISRALAEVIK